MQQIPSSELKNKFGSVIKKIQTEAVQITSHGEPVAIVISPEQYENMGGDRARLLAVLKRNQQVAAANGITEQKLAELLNEG